MGFANVVRAEEAEAPPQRPLILCDVGGTLLSLSGDMKSNQELITLLNRAVDQGFEVRICTGGVDTGTWEKFDRPVLNKTNLDPTIIRNADGKKNIGPNTYSGVVAIIDDDAGGYIDKVIAGNPNAKHFTPGQLEDLTRHIQVVKARGPAVNNI